MTNTFKRPRTGFSLIEVMVSLVLLAIILVSLARASTVIAVRGRTNDLNAKRTSVLQMEANKFGAIPFASIAGWSTVNKTFTKGDFTYTRRLTISSQNATNTRYLIKIVVIPSIDATKGDSVTIERTLPPTGSPLCLGC
jgi:prepilin-type N-terminal cleavage/methylation domain-containing protein